MEWALVEETYLGGSPRRWHKRRWWRCGQWAIIQVLCRWRLYLGAEIVGDLRTYGEVIQEAECLEGKLLLGMPVPVLPPGLTVAYPYAPLGEQVFHLIRLVWESPPVRPPWLPAAPEPPRKSFAPMLQIEAKCATREEAQEAATCNPFYDPWRQPEGGLT
jgi:hypothetical protein